LDMNARTIDGKTPYNLAIEADKKDVADYLAAQGADQSPHRYPVLTGDYFGQQKPGGKAVRWLILGRIFSPMVFTPDGNEAYWCNISRQLCFSKRINGTWTAPPRSNPPPKVVFPFLLLMEISYFILLKKLMNRNLIIFM